MSNSCYKEMSCEKVFDAWHSCIVVSVSVSDLQGYKRKSTKQNKLS